MDVCRQAHTEPSGQWSLAEASGIYCNVNNSDNPSEVVLARPELAEEVYPHPCNSRDRKETSSQQQQEQRCKIPIAVKEKKILKTTPFGSTE